VTWSAPLEKCMIQGKQAKMNLLGLQDKKLRHSEGNKSTKLKVSLENGKRYLQMKG